MEAFEALIAMLLENDGYWVKINYKVNLTKEEKRKIGRPSSPRWDIDIIAYKGESNELRLVECKAYLDSAGVRYSAFDRSDSRRAERYKLFNDSTLRRVVTHRVVSQLVATGSCRRSPKVVLCLAAGKIKSEEDHTRLRKHFSRRHWLLLDQNWIIERLRAVSQSGYQNEVAAIVAKLLERASKAA